MEANAKKGLLLGISAKEIMRKNEWLIPLAILIVTAFAYLADAGATSNTSHMDSRINSDVNIAIGTEANTLSKAELSRVYLENSVQNEKAGYEMVWATSCSSANVRVAGLDKEVMKKLNPAITNLNNKYGKADNKAIDRIFEQNAYSVCAMYDVELNEIQQHALSNLRGEDKSFSCLTPIRRVCSMVSM